MSSVARLVRAARIPPTLMFRQKAAAAADTDVSCVTVQTVHQHTAPVVDGDAQKILDGLEQSQQPPRLSRLKFLDAVTDRLAAAVKEAVGRLQPFDRLGTGQAKVERVASSRRIITADGKLHGRDELAQARIRCWPICPKGTSIRC